MLNISFRSLVRFSTILIFFGTFSGADDAAIGLSLLSQGKHAEASEYISRAYNSNRTLPANIYAFATITTDGTSAKMLFNAVAGDSSAPDSLRSKALFRLGCLYESIDKYDSAYSSFSEASALYASNEYAHRSALAALKSGNISEAEKIWATMTSLDDTAFSSKALYYLGHIAYKQGDLDQAIIRYTNAAKTADISLEAAALAHAYNILVQKNDHEKIESYKKRLLKQHPFILEPLSLPDSAVSEANEWKVAIEESDILSRAASNDHAVKEETAGTSTKKEDETTGFTLQVGAFSSAENAKRLANKLKKDFKTVSIIKTKTDNSVLNRVRVGSFNTEQEAVEFGEKNFRKKNIAFRVVKE